MDHTDPSGKCLEDLCIGETILAVEGVEAVVDAVETYEAAESVATAAEGATEATEAASGTESASATEARTATEAARPNQGWKPGDDVRAPTRQGNSPSDRTITRREWKNEAQNPTRSDFTKEDMARMEKGQPPQRFNPRNPRNGGVESMERSHEPVPKREGGAQTTPRWPEEHEQVDPCRHTGYSC